ncbi:predicted protein [Naegleria gruberi]|uniref:Predicted protein n=1 Tax=Naegleria gruberi TaxID=5762 RepID=D2VWF2_NAEGR|nr:uncharacterized protein NAEGRDRAFT_56327 [Naegleria gruberi]EFC38826.1 predicted protein [Naegleria gruberi]|eukprot:XP_002671570.1 predicted protein [Naegleria gruberi strain NEG-M]
MSTTTTQHRVLLLGSGFVAGTTLESLTRDGTNTFVTVASRTLSKSIEMCKEYAHDYENRTAQVALDIENEHDKLSELVSQHDLAISLVPYTYHVLVAKACIQHRKNMVTTSYISPALRELDQQFKDLGIASMNEIGVDPGIDHMIATKIIHEEQDLKGGKIKSFYSWCGGLPHPDHIDNPMKYKFSWSPRGVLMALQNTAKWIEGGEIRVVEPSKLLASRRELNLAKDMPLFEGYPNRDSTPFKEHYNLKYADDVLRGTLRFKGNCEVVEFFIGAGLVDLTPRPDIKDKQWREIMKELLGAESVEESALSAALLKKLNLEPESEKAKSATHAFQFYGLFSEKVAPFKGTLLDTFSQTLLEQMEYKPGERDMLFMCNTFVIETAEGKKKTIVAKLVDFGDERGMSMAKTVGYPCAVATKKILNGEITTKGVFGPYEYNMNESIMKELKEVERIHVDYEVSEEQ